MPTTRDFLESVKAGTADESAQIALWHLVHRLNRHAKIDIVAPQKGWSLKVTQSADSRYVQIVAEGERSK